LTIDNFFAGLRPEAPSGRCSIIVLTLVPTEENLPDFALCGACFSLFLRAAKTSRSPQESWLKPSFSSLSGPVHA
jgi:hypothetical protein